MKCMTKEDRVIRVADNEAEEMKKQGWSFCPKAKWKKLKNVSQEK